MPSTREVILQLAQQKAFKVGPLPEADQFPRPHASPLARGSDMVMGNHAQGPDTFGSAFASAAGLAFPGPGSGRARRRLLRH